jgi:hypothetical protein
MAFRIKFPAAIFFLLFLSGCKPVHNVVGSYAHRANQSGIENYTLNIKADSTFLIVAHADMLPTNTVTGKWRVESKLLLLTRDSQLITKPFLRVQESHVKADTAVSIHLVDAADNKPLIAAGVKVNGSSFSYTTDLTGSVKIAGNFKLKRLNIAYPSIKESIAINDRTANDITILVDFNKVPPLKWIRVPKQMLVGKHSLTPVSEGRADTSAELVRTN